MQHGTLRGFGGDNVLLLFGFVNTQHVAIEELLLAEEIGIHRRSGEAPLLRLGELLQYRLIFADVAGFGCGGRESVDDIHLLDIHAVLPLQLIEIARHFARVLVVGYRIGDEPYALGV